MKMGIETGKTSLVFSRTPTLVIMRV